MHANSKKAVPVLSPAEKVTVSIFEAVAFSVVPKIILLYFFFFVCQYVFLKKIFLFFLLTRRGKSYIMYAVCFTWIVFVTISDGQ